MISYVKEYSSELINTISQEVANILCADQNHLLQFNLYNNIVISNIFDINISIPNTPSHIASHQISNKYRFIDKIFVFNNHEANQYKEYNPQILDIPIRNNSEILLNNFNRHKFYKFAYVGNLEYDLPIISNLLYSFTKSAMKNNNISMSLLLESDQKSLTNFKNQFYQQNNLKDLLNHRIYFMCQDQITQHTKETFINSIDSLVYATTRSTDNYLLYYALCNNTKVYSPIKYFDDISTIDSHPSVIYEAHEDIIYQTPCIQNLIDIFSHPKKSQKNSEKFLTSGIQNYFKS